MRVAEGVVPLCSPEGWPQVSMAIPERKRAQRGPFISVRNDLDILEHSEMRTWETLALKYISEILCLL